MNKLMLMSMAALGISIAVVSAGMGQQLPAASKGAGAAQAPAGIQKSVSTQTAPAKENWEKVRGVVEGVNVGSNEVTIKTQEGKMMTFAVGRHSYITEVTTGIPLSALKKGTGVTVEYAKEGSQLMAKWVDVHMEKAEAKPMILAQAAKEGKKENPPAASASAPTKEVKKEGSSAPQGQAKEVKKETSPVSQPSAKGGTKENPAGKPAEKK